MGSANIVSEELAIFVSLDTRAAKLTRLWGSFGAILGEVFLLLSGREEFVEIQESNELHSDEMHF